MPSWDHLPEDVVRIILYFLSLHSIPHRAAQMMQSVWRRYRTIVLLGRFRMLRYLRDFRDWNPSASAFLARARL